MARGALFTLLLEAFVSWPQTPALVLEFFVYLPKAALMGSGRLLGYIRSAGDRQGGNRHRILETSLQGSGSTEKNSPLERLPINSLWIEDLWPQNGQMGIFKGAARSIL